VNIQSAILYVGSTVIFLWGVGHLMPTRDVVAGFGSISSDNRKIITMEWVIEGLTLCFLGVTVALATASLGADAAGTRFVARSAGAMLFVLAGVSAFTGARTAVLPMKLCPVIKTVVGLAFVGASSM
jgi:hypothetical protein